MDGAEAPEGKKMSKAVKKLRVDLEAFKKDQQDLVAKFKNNPSYGEILEEQTEKFAEYMNTQVTTQAEAELQEINEIITYIDKYIRFGENNNETLSVVKHPEDTISILIQLLVSKGLITIQDVKRVLK